MTRKASQLPSRNNIERRLNSPCRHTLPGRSDRGVSSAPLTRRRTSMEPNLSSKLVTPDLLTPIAKVNSTFPIPYKFSLLQYSCTSFLLVLVESAARHPRTMSVYVSSRVAGQRLAALAEKVSMTLLRVTQCVCAAPGPRPDFRCQAHPRSNG